MLDSLLLFIIIFTIFYYIFIRKEENDKEILLKLINEINNKEINNMNVEDNVSFLLPTRRFFRYDFPYYYDPYYYDPFYYFWYSRGGSSTYYNNKYRHQHKHEHKHEHKHIKNHHNKSNKSIKTNKSNKSNNSNKTIYINSSDRFVNRSKLRHNKKKII